MAVSGTGFSPSAIDAAKSARIDLRALESLTPDAILSWLPSNAPLIIRDGRFSGVRVFVGLKSNSSEKGPEPMGQLVINEKIFLDHTSEEVISLLELWQRVVRKDVLWKDIEEGGPLQEAAVSALEILQEDYSLVRDGEYLPVQAIQFDCTLQIIIPRMPLVSAAEYSTAGTDSKEAFARIGTWEGPEDGLIRSLTIIGFLKQDSEVDEN